MRWLIWALVMTGLGAGVLLLAGRFPGQDRQDWAGVAWGAALLTAACARIFTTGRIDWSQKARHAAIWLGLVCVVALGFTYRGELMDVVERVRGELIPSLAQTGPARELVISQGEGGFLVMGQVNGQPVRFLVDTGATDTVLSPADAHRAGLDTPELDFNSLAETANGTGRGARATAATLSVGSITYSNVPVLINQAPMSSSLLGLSFLRRLDSFEVRDGRLHLKPRS